MNDLETRVREALHEEVAARPAGTLLDDVRRDARHRRTRRTTSLVVVTVLVVAGAVVGLTAGRHDDASPVPSHATQVGTPDIADLSVSASGERFEASRGGNDASPLTEIWTQRGRGAWVQRGTVPDLTSQVTMAPDGTNGWAPGMTAVWSTHDGGRTWARVPGLPAGVGIMTGPEVAWAMAPGSHPRLWRAPVGSDDWAQVTLPTLPAMAQMENVLSDSRVVLGAPGPVRGDTQRVVVGDGTTWQRFGVPCYPVPELFGGTPSTRSERCGLARTAGGFEGQPLPTSPGAAVTGSSVDLDMVTSPGRPVGPVRSLYVAGRHAVVYSPDGREAAHLVLGPRESIRQLAITGRQAVLSTSRNRVFGSEDGGLTWTRLP